MNRSAAGRGPRHLRCASPPAGAGGVDVAAPDALSAEDDEAHLLALLSLPEMGPRRLTALLAERSPEAVWAALGRWRSLRGQLPDGRALHGNAERLYQRWARARSGLDPATVARRHRERGVRVIPFGAAAYPDRLRDDPDPPAVLFTSGGLGALDAPLAAVVGTRRATAYGLGVAREWAAELSAAGVGVVSGLAGGIDAAAHAGALAPAVAAPPVGVVGTGLDVVYPTANAALWRAVAEGGLLVSEAPLGATPEPWRFPARNRIIAALAQVVVVVESHERGGALITAELAEARGRAVLAVPGSVRSPASAGTNRLIEEGAGIAVGPGDVLAHLALPAHGRARVAEVALSVDEAAVLDAVGWEPATVGEVVERLRWSVGRVCVAVDGLLRGGCLVQEGPHIHQRGDR